MRIDVQVRGAKEAAAVIDRMVALLEDPAPFFRREAIPILARSLKSAFDTGGASQGSPWRKLNKRTVAEKGNAKVLIDKGKLRDALIRPSNQNNQTMIMRTQLRYGPKMGPANVPQAWNVSRTRPFARADNKTTDRLSGKLRDYLVGL